METNHKITIGATLLATVLAVGSVRYGPVGSGLREVGAKIDSALFFGDETLPKVRDQLESFSGAVDFVSEQYGTLEVHIDALSDRLDVDEAVDTRAEVATDVSTGYIQNLGTRAKSSRFNPFKEDLIDKATQATSNKVAEAVNDGANGLKEAVPEIPRDVYENVGQKIDDVRIKADELEVKVEEVTVDYRNLRERTNYNFETLIPNLATGAVAAPFLFFLAGYGVSQFNERRNRS